MDFSPATLHTILDHMFQLPLPVLEKLARPVIVYLVLVVLLRLFGKRELAQLNPFDLVVLLSLSNTVQNAIIGDDNSVSGGVIGAFGLLAINWIVARVLYRSRKLTGLLGGQPAILIKNGKIDQKALQKESLTLEELMDVVHKQGFADMDQVKNCTLEPNGTFYIETADPTLDDRRHSELLEKLESLSKEIAILRAAGNQA